MSDIRNTIPQPGTYGIRGEASRRNGRRSGSELRYAWWPNGLQVGLHPGLHGPGLHSPSCSAASLCGSSPWNPVLATAAWCLYACMTGSQGMQNGSQIGSGGPSFALGLQLGPQIGSQY